MAGAHAWLAGLFVSFTACSAHAPAEHPGPTSWDSMSGEQKLQYMESTVMPRMKALFESYDPHRFSRMTCKSCHGADGAQRRWITPSPELLLEETKWNTGAAAPDAAPSEFDAFMARSVGPEMAKLLGRPYGAPNGFGCFGCHAPER